MEQSENSPSESRPRANTATVRDDGLPAPTPGVRRAATGDWEGLSPTRMSFQSPDGASIRQRKSTQTRRSAIPSLAPQTTLTERVGGNFTTAGPDETSRLHANHRPFVQPGYAELNPAYDQAPNTKPVWSLAKPLPRVVRPGMVPTKSELLQNRANPQFPAENSQNIGLDVDPNDLEKGQIPKAGDPRKMAAQVTDARRQRETNFLNAVLNNDGNSLAPPSSRLSRISSSRMRRPGPGKWEDGVEELSTVDESTASQKENETEDVSDRPLQPSMEEPDLLGPHPDDAKPGEEVPQAFPSIDEAAYPEDLHPLLQDLVEDEIHNNHTVWSVIRTHHREALAESLGVFVQLTLGFCGDLAVVLAAAGNPNTTDWVWGFATMMAIYISGGISGAHLNPAITMMLWFYRGFPKRKMPEYFAAQFIGAFIAALAAYGVYYHSIHNYLILNPSDKASIVDSFVTSQREDYIVPVAAFFNEFLGTAILAITILALGDDQNAPPGGGMNALIIGLVITVVSMCFAFQTGGAFNPSRDFGPRLALLALGYGSELFTNPYWFYGPWAGALTGAFVGAFIYDFMVFTGGESPVNYPLDRTKRALKKSRTKWAGRLHLSKESKDKVTQ